MNEVKPFLDVEKQIEKIRSRGCRIDDAVSAKRALAATNYYRLSAYFLPFKQIDGNYKQGTKFETICRIYEFDRKLRGIVFSALARVEILLRARLAYYHAEHYGALGYNDVTNYRVSGHNHARFKEQVQSEIEKNKKVLFVSHHIQKYGGKFPIWVIIELFTFGMLSRFYADLKSQDQKILVKELSAATPKTLMSWLRCCTDLRNICAHHGRLYYRIFPAIPAGLNETGKQRIFGMLLVLKTLYADKAEWNEEIYNAICNLTAEYKNDINFNHIGFTADWRTRLRN
jgi:abortive infection bacteriophage resistance protein